MRQHKESEIILNDDGSIYHLNLLPEEVADHIITVGNPDRVARVSKYFDEIEVKKHKREFITHTGTYQGTRITVLSTGIGTDNIDIIMNEIEALKNFDLQKREPLTDRTLLNFYRLGTSGALIEEIPVDSIVISEAGIGLDGLMHFYPYKYTLDEKELALKINKKLHQFLPDVKSYTCMGSRDLIDKFLPLGTSGYTLTANGFYGPQGRSVIISAKSATFLDDLRGIDYNGYRVTNLEMETSALYGLANMLGHKAVSINTILANRASQLFSEDPAEAVDIMIQKALDIIVS